MSFGGLAAVDFRRPGDAFLSCLCGSEHYDTAIMGEIRFLSCLSGSEPKKYKNFRRSGFLSCLSGSELLGSQL